MEVIFDLSRRDWDYKGVLFAELDNLAIDKLRNWPFPTPKNYVAGVMAVIWTDEKGFWHIKTRIKFPSGNKQVYELEFNDGNCDLTKINETFILQKIYEMPMINKTWTKNPDGTPEGILKIIQDLDMIESVEFIKE